MFSNGNLHFIQDCFGTELPQVHGDWNGLIN